MRRMNRRVLPLLLLMPLVAAAGCMKSAPPALAQLPDVDTSAVLGHVKVLSADEFEGRAPGSKGEELSVAYLIDQFKKIGLKPGNTDGTYVQKVPLVGITPDPKTSLLFRNTSPSAVSGTAARRLKFKDDVVAWTKHVADTASIDNSEVIFVGYGASAPEYSC